MHRRKYKMNQIIASMFVLFFSLTLLSCYNRQTGCLDPLSANFSVTADDACGDCCKDPELILNIRHLVENKLVSPDSVLMNEMGQKYKILNFAYYLSGFEVIQSDGTIVSVSQSIAFISNAGIVRTPDDFGIYRRTNVSTKLGSVRKFGEYRSLRFVLGIKDEWQTWTPVDLPLLHPLNDSLRLRTADGMLIHQSLTIAKGDNFEEISTYNLRGPGKSVLYSLDTVFNNAIGTNINLTIKADYSQWLKNVDITQTGPDAEIKILENSKQLFSVN
jgi:hypothetical protein